MLYKSTSHKNKLYLQHRKRFQVCDMYTGEFLPCLQLWSNADEADLRVWLYCVPCEGREKLLDTDVYHIGLTIEPQQPETNIVVSYIQDCLEKDPISFCFKTSYKPSMLTLTCMVSQYNYNCTHSLYSLYNYICTGCDYVLFFQGMGFLSTFFQNASLIAGGSEAPESGGKVTLDKNDIAILA